jgi:WD40 repeat protein
MKLVEGRSLKDLIGEKKTLEERLLLMPHVLAVSETMAYAHSQRIIHRDLKPANVIVGAYGETLVIDWGVAKDLHESEPSSDDDSPYRSLPSHDLTVPGSAVGTPAYMPPEQARGHEVDERSDVYALGALLFHVLAGVPPYHRAPSADVLAGLREGRRESLSVREPRVPPDLAALVDKAMAGSPADRYPTAMALRDELARFLAGQRVQAHAYTLWAVAAKWIHRNKALAIVGATAAVLLAVGAAFSYRQIILERDEARGQRSRAEGALDLATKRNGKLMLSQSSAFLESDPTTSIRWLKQYEGDEWGSVRTLGALAYARGVARHVLPLKLGAIVQVEYLPGGESFVFVSQQGLLAEAGVPRGGVIRIHAPAEPFFDTTENGSHVVFASGATVLVFDRKTRAASTLGTHAAKVTTVIAERSGAWFASASIDGQIKVWSPAGGERRFLTGHNKPVHSIAASPDGLKVASTGDDLTARLWSVESGEGSVLGASADGSRISFSASGRYLAWSSPQGRAVVHDLQTQTSRELETYSSLAGPFAFGGDDYVACATAANEVRAWSLRDGRELYRSTTGSRVYAIDFSRERNPRLMWADHRLSIVDLASGQKDLLSTKDSIWSITDDASGAYVLTAGIADSVRVWRMPARRYRILTKHENRASTLAFSADGRLLASAGADGIVRITIVDTGKELGRFTGPGGYVGSLIFDPDTRVLIASSYDGRLYLYTLSDSTLRTVQAHDGAVLVAAYLSESGTLVTGGMDKRLRLWDLQGQALGELVGHTSPISSIAQIGPGSIVAGDGHGQLWSWDVATEKGTRLGHGRGRIESIALEPGCPRLAFGGRDGGPYVLDVARSDQVWLGSSRGRGLMLDLSRDCRYLTAVARDGAIALHDLEKQTESRLALGAPISATAFVADGTVAASGTAHGMLVIWDAAQGKQKVISLGLGAVQDIETSSRRELAIATASGHVALVSVEFDWQIPETKDGTTRWLQDVSDVTGAPNLDEECLECTGWMP